jgi:hypothetical protein
VSIVSLPKANFTGIRKVRGAIVNEVPFFGYVIPPRLMYRYLKFWGVSILHINRNHKILLGVHWKWGQKSPRKLWYLHTILNGVISHKAWTLNVLNNANVYTGTVNLLGWRCFIPKGKAHNRRARRRHLLWSFAPFFRAIDIPIYCSVSPRHFCRNSDMYYKLPVTSKYTCNLLHSDLYSGGGGVHFESQPDHWLFWDS